MKLLKIFGVVVGIHLFALVLIFANPGCSSPSQPPSASDTAAKNSSGAEISGPTAAPSSTDYSSNAPASVSDSSSPAISISPGIRYSPTRPNTSAATALEAEPVAGVTPATTYTVGKGDSLWTIAKKNHIAVSDLAAANNLKSGSTVRVNQRLIIPGKSNAPGAPVATQEAAPAPSATPPRASADSVRHVVKNGETLGAIARKYQVKVGDIATANAISNPANIRAGMELVIPGWQAPSGKSGKGATKAAKATTAATPPPEEVVPTISVSDRPAPSDAPPIITVDEAPAPKK